MNTTCAALPLLFAAMGLTLNLCLIFFAPANKDVAAIAGKASEMLITGAIAVAVPNYNRKSD